jgi:RNA polymerase sigma factor (sigma-70 family)
MAGGHIGRALRRLRGLLGAHGAEGPTDGDLLRRYVYARDEAAFEALLRRHGPMVLGVCRRLLSDGEDVDDAFQATFLILVRKAPSISDAERVGNWLYGVAYRVAVRARAQAARLRARQRPLNDVPSEEPQGDPVRDEVRALLDDEVSRLPARYREAVVCCYLQGRTQDEAARVLGWPRGTVATRLNRARRLLRNRLVRRGLPLSAGTLVGALRAASAEGALPAPLVGAALRAAGQGVAGSALPPAVVRLADGVLRQFLVARVKAVTAAVLALALVTGGGGLALRSARPAAAPEAEAPQGEAQPAQYYAWREQHAPPAGAAVAACAVGGLPGKEPAPCDPGARLTAIVLAADGKLLAAVSEDGTVCLCDPVTGQPCLSVRGATFQQGPSPGLTGAIEPSGKVNASALGSAAGPGAGGRSGPACKVVITFEVAGESGSVRVAAGCSSGRESGQELAEGRLARSVVPPGTRQTLIETRVWSPAAHTFVPTSKVVIHTLPPCPAAAAAPAPPPEPGARPEVKRAKKCPRCTSAVI